ncbi:MAG: sensor histidine kinase [Gemmatimonadaceae bacterium]
MRPIASSRNKNESTDPNATGGGSPTVPKVISWWDRWRLALHVGVLLLVLAGSAVLAVESYLAHRSYAARAQAAARSLALEAAVNLSRGAQGRLSFNLLMYFIPAASRAEYDTPERQANFSKMALEPAKGKDCAAPQICTAGPARTTFHWDLRTNAWRTNGAPFDSATAAAVRDSVRDEAMHRYQNWWELAVLWVPVNGRTHTVLYRLAFDSAGKPATVNGYEVDMPRVANEMFARALAQTPLLASADTQRTNNQKLFSVNVVAKDGDQFLHAGLPDSTAPVLARYDANDTFGKYRVEIGLGPTLMARVTGGTGDNTRLVTTLLVFLASVVLIGLAIVQTRREYALAYLRESFVASVSHELRTPLAQIRLYSEMLQLGFVRNAGEQTAAVGTIVHEAGRLTYLIENVLTYSRATRDELRLEASPVEVDGVIVELARTVGPMASAAGMTLRTTAEPGLVAAGDRAAVLQVLVNLVDNAIRHGKSGGEAVVSAARAGDAVRFIVDDDGPGIPPRDRKRVWRRFVRLEGRTRATGSGIGLSVVAELVSAMGGRTWVTESPLGGARFVVEIPAGIAEPAPQRGPMLRSGAGVVAGLALLLLAHGQLAAQATGVSVAPAASASQAAAASDTICARPRFRQFDFWAGDWVVRDSSGNVIGSNHVTRDVGGCALHEHWAGAGGHGIGESFSGYVPNDGKWHQMYVGSGGYVFVMSGTFDGDRLVMFTPPRPSQRDPKLQVVERWSWTPIDSTHVRQRAEVSTDAGASWKTIFNGLYERASR